MQNNGELIACLGLKGGILIVDALRMARQASNTFTQSDIIPFKCNKKIVFFLQFCFSTAKNHQTTVNLIGRVFG